MSNFKLLFRIIHYSCELIDNNWFIKKPASRAQKQACSESLVYTRGSFTSNTKSTKHAAKSAGKFIMHIEKAKTDLELGQTPRSIKDIVTFLQPGSSVLTPATWGKGSYGSS